MDRSTWNPVEEPYRVCRYYNSARRGCFGWVSSTQTFSSLVQALTFCEEEPWKRSETSRDVHVAKNPEDWRNRGGWKRAAKRIHRPRRSVTHAK